MEINEINMNKLLNYSKNNIDKFCIIKKLEKDEPKILDFSQLLENLFSRNKVLNNDNFKREFEDHYYTNCIYNIDDKIILDKNIHGFNNDDGTSLKNLVINNKKYYITIFLK